MLSLPEMAPRQAEVMPFAGGLDMVTSAYQLPPGALRSCVNIACRSNGGYYRIPGYERFDGRFQPHNAEQLPIAITLDSGKAVHVGDVGTFGNISGTVAYVDPNGLFVSLTKTFATFAVPTFVPGPIIIAADTKGQATGYYTNLRLKDLAKLRAAAANIYRADILPVPGSGPILGCVTYKDDTYAFRNNVGGTAADIYRSSPTGWELVPLGRKVTFSNLTEMPPAADTLVQGAVTATIDRTVILTGDVTQDNAAGYFIVSNVSGGPFTIAAATFTGGTCDITSVDVAIVILPNGVYNFSIGNFFATDDSERIYGADSVNDGFEFDGTHYVPIVVPDLEKKPSYAMVHVDHLFFAIGASLIHSAIGNPYNFEVLKGAGEIGTGGDITGLVLIPGSQSGAALMVLARNSTWILYGSSSTDWKFVNFNQGIGGWDRTGQNLFEAFALDDRGVTQMKQSLNYGNFDAATLTYNIRPFIETVRGMVVCSGLSRENSQYRLYFNNGYGLYVTTSPQGFVGHGLVLFPDIPTCYDNGHVSTGETFDTFGTADGYVMRNDVGSSFDGKKIPAQFITNINTEKSPRVRKRFRRMVLEVQATTYIEVNIGYSFDWATPTILPESAGTVSGDFAGLSYWDSMIWDSFFWDGRTNDAISVELNGSGENMQVSLLCNDDYMMEFTLPSATIQFTPRRPNR